MLRDDVGEPTQQTLDERLSEVISVPTEVLFDGGGAHRGADEPAVGGRSAEGADVDLAEFDSRGMLIEGVRYTEEIPTPPETLFVVNDAPQRELYRDTVQLWNRSRWDSSLVQRVLAASAGSNVGTVDEALWSGVGVILPDQGAAYGAWRLTGSLFRGGRFTPPEVERVETEPPPSRPPVLRLPD